MGEPQVVVENFVQDATSPTGSGEPAPLILIVMFALLSVWLLIVHALFRAGQPTSRWRHAGHMRGVQVLLGYSALPGSMSMTFPVAFMMADRIWSFSPSVFPWVGLPFLLAFAACGIWSYKEFERPTLKRTPTWVRTAMEHDPELREVIYGKRRDD
ncbi:hypothetical protein ACFV9G_20570 [Nocardioides sp. NPDC059952]|uniref:hypothetical protein n=1 Tax=Nocardioides sp. NPDC059952 TaxID=3347014 RepID=UPI00364B6960